MTNLTKLEVEERVVLLKTRIDKQLTEIGAPLARYSVSTDRHDAGPYARSLPGFSPYTGKIRVKVRQSNGGLLTFYLGPRQSLEQFDVTGVAARIAECQHARDTSNERERQRGRNVVQERSFIDSLSEDDRKFCRVTGQGLVELRFAVPSERVAEVLVLLRKERLIP